MIVVKSQNTPTSMIQHLNDVESDLNASGRPALV